MFPRTKGKLIAINAFCLFLVVAFGIIKERLLDNGYLNKRDLGFVGGETGTMGEYLTNIWHWDVASGILTFLAVCYLIGSLISFFSKPKKDNEVAVK